VSVRQPTTRRLATELLTQMREALAAAESGELPVSAAYRHRLEGGITALEAALGRPSSLVDRVRV
jgi:hypothetical protein